MKLSQEFIFVQQRSKNHSWRENISEIIYSIDLASGWLLKILKLHTHLNNINPSSSAHTYLSGVEQYVQMSLSHSSSTQELGFLTKPPPHYCKLE